MTSATDTGGYPAIDPSSPGALAARVAELERVAERLERIVGHSPDAATGDPGAGLCRVVAVLADDRRDVRRGMIKVGAGAGVGGAGVALLLELGLRLLNLFGG